MSLYVELNVSLKTVFICIINEKGKVVKGQELASTPEGNGNSNNTAWAANGC